MEDTEVKIATKSLGGFSVGSLDAQGEFLELRVAPTPEQIPDKRGERREETQPLPCILLPLPLRAPAWTVLELPAVPAPDSRLIVGMDLGESKRRAASSGLVLQRLCSILVLTSRAPQDLIHSPTLGIRGPALIFCPESREKADTFGQRLESFSVKGAS